LFPLENFHAFCDYLGPESVSIEALSDNCQDIVDSIYCHDIVDPKL
jgi:hypothetical protein